MKYLRIIEDYIEKNNDYQNIIDKYNDFIISKTLINNVAKRLEKFNVSQIDEEDIEREINIQIEQRLEELDIDSCEFWEQAQSNFKGDN